MLKRLRKQLYNFRKFNPVVEEWAYWLQKTFDASKKNKFILFTQGRTGSTLLLNLLNQHPNIYCDNELIQRKFSNTTKYLDGRALMHSEKVYGLKLKPHQIIKYLNIEKSRTVVKDLYDNGWKIVYLRRGDFFRHALSNQIAQQRGYFFKTQSEFNNVPKAYLDPEAVRAEYKARFKFKQDEDDALSGLAYKEVVYEQDLMTADQRKDTLSNICRFLNVSDSFTPVVPFVKSTQEDLSRVVSNIDEINSELKH
jgi:LPS sulfotransferase NodH